MYLQQADRVFFTEQSIRELKIGSSNFRFPSSAPAVRFIYELCWTLVRGELPLQKCKAALEAVAFTDCDSEQDLGLSIADVVAGMAQDDTMPGEYRSRLIKLGKWLVESALVPLRFFQECCDDEFLMESELIKIRAEDLQKKKIRVRTRLHFQQTKFNLLREESEGYAKLVTLLCQLPQTSSAAVMGTMESLIGHFDLDPNRVLDIIIECLELHPDDDVGIFLELISMFSKPQTSDILEFRFRANQQYPPISLFRLTALLIKQDLVDMDAILSYLLLPNDGDKEAFDNYNAFCARRLDEASKIGKINLAATGKDLMDDDDDENKQGADISVHLFSALDMEAEAVSERLPELENNQALGLLMGFMAVDDWYHARILLARLNNAVEHVQICIALFRLIDMKSANSNMDELLEMLVCVGPYMYRDTLLLQKVCRVVKDDARLELIEEALGACLLPSLHLVPANPAVGHEIWELLNRLPYEARYRLYGEWEKVDEQRPMILAARQVAKLDTRRILKRLTKENSKTIGRMVAKLAHANPVTVLRTIVHQVEAYKDMIPLVVDALKYLTQLEFDVLEYVVIERLALAGRDKMKDDGLNLSDWLQTLASFWGCLCRKYPSKVYMRGLFQYLINQLKRGHGIELVLLQQLIQQMANVEHTENMTEDQLDFMATAKKNKSTNRLRNSLLEPNLAVPLLLLVAQHRSAVVINADAPHIKMVSEEFDRCNGILLQYVEFLSSSVTPASSYALLIPTLAELVHRYHLEPEVAFHIYRPVMRPLEYGEEASSTLSISWTDLLGTVRTMLPSTASLSPDLYAAFWGLTLYDLYVPRKRYESEMAKQHAGLKALEAASDNSSSAITRRKKEREGIHESLDRLTMELQKHQDRVASVHRHLAREKEKWLSSCTDDTLKMNMEFLQHCIFPRCTFSMPDAVYCAMFVNTLHSLGTPLVNHMDVLICKTLQPMICCSTEYEAGRLGKFLLETGDYWKNWKWSERITRILIRCLESTEYMEIRNGLILLTKISSVFPVTRKSGISLEKRVVKIKGDEREDLKVLAAGVGAALAARKASWISTQKRASPCEEADTASKRRRESEKEPSIAHRQGLAAQRSSPRPNERERRRDDAKRGRDDDRKWGEAAIKTWHHGYERHWDADKRQKRRH